MIFAMATAFFYSVWKPSTEAAKRTVCMGNLKNIYRALSMYSSNYDERLPIGNWENIETWRSVLEPYLENREGLITAVSCPSDQRQKTLRGQRIWHSYQINKNLEGRLLSDCDLLPIAWDVNGGIGDTRYTNHKDGGNVIRGDGSCGFLPCEKWDATNMPKRLERY